MPWHFRGNLQLPWHCYSHILSSVGQSCQWGFLLPLLNSIPLSHTYHIASRLMAACCSLIRLASLETPYPQRTKKQTKCLQCTIPKYCRRENFILSFFLWTFSPSTTEQGLYVKYLTGAIGSWCALIFTFFLLFIYSHVHRLFGSFLLPIPSTHLLPPKARGFQAEPVLPLSLILLKRRHKHNKKDKDFLLVELRTAIQRDS
jgi:hypothetical protein